jgi:hypothetical protein
VNQRQSTVSAFARSGATSKLFAFPVFSSAFVKLRRDKRGKRNPCSSVFIRGWNVLRSQRLCVEKIASVDSELEMGRKQVISKQNMLPRVNLIHGETMSCVIAFRSTVRSSTPNAWRSNTW